MARNIQQPQQRVVLRDESCGEWLEFMSPCQIIKTQKVEDVLPLIRQIENAVQHNNLYAAGFISYEAAPAFDSSLAVKDDGTFPLLWFGLFEQVRKVPLPTNNQRLIPALQWQMSVTQEEYNSSFHRIRTLIRNGDTYQVNFTYRLITETEFNPWHLFTKIAGEDAPFAAFVDTPDWSICSASPELFLRLDGEYIESRPMKGTAERGLWYDDDQLKAADLRSSEKERAENVMIVDMVRNDLGRVALCGSVHVPSLFELEKYPTVWQMTSTVRARTHESLDKILQAMFPPASITGAPKRQTMQIIAELEQSPRHIYTGTIGFLCPGRHAQFNVAIRTILLKKAIGYAEYGVGGGIVWDSKQTDEYKESLTKTKVLNASMRDFDLLETILWSSFNGFLLLKYHMKRLAQSADYFSFHADLRQIRRQLTGVTDGLSSGLYRIRLLVSRRGNVRFEVSAIESKSMCFGNLVLAKKPINISDVFLYHKTTCRCAYEDALKMCPGNNDVLLFNEEGHITESTLANVAIEIDGKLYTPPVRCGLLPGTYREFLLDSGQLTERIISIHEVFNSKDVYLLNSIRGSHKINILDG